MTQTPELHQLVTTLETSRRLRELGITAPAFAMHNYITWDMGYNVLPSEDCDTEQPKNYWAYTAEELLPMFKFGRGDVFQELALQALKFLELDQPYADYLGQSLAVYINHGRTTAEQCNGRALKPKQNI